MKMKIKHLGFAVAVAVAVAVAGALALGALIKYVFPSHSEQMAALSVAMQTIDDRSRRLTEKDGAADYLAKVAVAKAKIEEIHPLASYKPISGIEGRTALDEIYFKGVPATAQSVEIAKSFVNGGRLSPDEMYAMINILASLHNRENTTGANDDIALELKRLAADPKKLIAGRAAISYARLEYLPGTESVLRKAFENGALDSDSYYRELAHLVTSAPLEKQKEFVAEIRASSNRLGIDVLTVALNSGEAFNAAPFLKSSEDMAEMLRANEPGFNYGVGLYGGVDAVRYREWIRASASAKTGRTMDDVIVATLSMPGTDPRKIMAYLSSSEAMSLLADAAPNSQVQRLASIAQRHADQNPGNSDMAETAMLIASRMKNPPPALLKPVFAMPTGPVPGPEPILQTPQTIPGPGR